jgi:hypothetical protein
MGQRRRSAVSTSTSRAASNSCGADDDGPRALDDAGLLGRDQLDRDRRDKAWMVISKPA